MKVTGPIERPHHGRARSMCEWFLPELNDDGIRGSLDLPNLRENIENLCRCYMDAAGLKNARLTTPTENKP